jgi:hypothetical protein
MKKFLNRLLFIGISALSLREFLNLWKGNIVYTLRGDPAYDLDIIMSFIDYYPNRILKFEFHGLTEDIDEFKTLMNSCGYEMTERLGRMHYTKCLKFEFDRKKTEELNRLKHTLAFHRL